MARQLPKNVRQIGNVSDSSKIYIEDYVDTFFNQLCEKANEEMLGAFLIGEIVQEDENDYIYVSGAISMKNLGVKGKDLVVGEHVWKDACETCKEYFGNAEILGWFITGGQPVEMNHNIHKIHQKYFPREKSIFVTKNSRDREEKFYIYKYREMLECKGHFIYYEKNVEMQNYMISCRKKTGMSPSEIIEDRAAKNFRSIIQEKLDKTEKKNHSRLVYAASVFLVLVVLVIGVTMINNYDKMQGVHGNIGQVAEGEPEENDTDIPQADLEEPKVDLEEPKVDNEEEEDAVATVGPVTGTVEQENDVQQEENELMPETQLQNSEEEPQEPADQENENPSIQTEEIYIVEKGDTLASISREIYGDITHIGEICELNGLEDGNLIMIGQKLLLP